MAPFPLILLVAAFVIFVIAVFGPSTGRWGLVPAGLACWSLSEILGKV